ncbi:MAG TPA: hypothetical protein VNW71_10335, partial [Thermoanaerobaculia bacterium]|nr:hypothetical protein [Thermoanaerobaculia bacterium]
EASLGPLARAARIAAAGRDALREQPGDDEELEDWLLRLEGIAREIDAGFAPETLPPELVEVRRRIVEALRGGPTTAEFPDIGEHPELKAVRSS